MGYTQYGWSALRRRTRRSVLNSNFHDVFMDVFAFPPGARSRRRPAPGVRPRRPQTGQLANGERAREHARESQVSGLAPQPPAYLVPSPAFPLSSYRSGRDRIADCNRVYIAAGPPQSTVLSPRQARVDRAPDSRVLRPSESLKVDSRRARSNTFPHTTDTPTRTDTQGHRTGPGQGGATARGVRQADPAP